MNERISISYAPAEMLCRCVNWCPVRNNLTLTIQTNVGDWTGTTSECRSAACFVCKRRAAPRGEAQSQGGLGTLNLPEIQIWLSNFPVLFSQFKITSWCCCCCYSSSNPQLNESIFDKVIGALVPRTIIAITQFKYKSSQKLREFTATSYTLPPPPPPLWAWYL